MSTIYLWSTFVTIWPAAGDEFLVAPQDIPALPADRYRIKRADSWQYSERVLSALHTLNARADVELIDPTGLLGGSRYGTDENRPGKPPVFVSAKYRAKTKGRSQ